MLTSFVLGSFVGLTSSLLGLGGGFLLVPLLPLIYSLNPHETVALSLFIVFFSTSLNSFLFYKRGYPVLEKKEIFGGALLGGLGGALFGSFLSYFLMKLFLILILFLLILLFVFKDLKKRPLKDPYKKVYFLSGALAGFLSGVSGVGAGFVALFFLTMLSGTPKDKLSPFSNLAVMGSSLMASSIYLLQSHGRGLYEHSKEIALVVLGVLIFSYLGVRFQKYLSLSFRRGAILFFLALVFIKEVWVFTKGAYL